jgi:hypothetical protein
MQSNTIFTLDGTRLDKAELDILHFVDSWLPTFNRWSVAELAQKCNLYAPDATAAIDMLVLHGLFIDRDLTCVCEQIGPPPYHPPTGIYVTVSVHVDS